MKKLINLLVFAFVFNFISLAQTGQGVTMQLSSPTSFVPTTVDSTSYLELIFTNSVNSQQIVTFSNLSLPFDIQSSLTIGALDSDTIQMSFTPTSIGVFSDTLIWNADVFGSGLFEVNGEGVQVSIGTSVDSLDLGSLTLGSSVSGSFDILNNGTGTMNVTNITCVDTNVVITPNNFLLSQGGSSTVNLTFTPVVAGYLNVPVLISSNDPNTPIDTVILMATTISEISGNFCGTLTKINSPYTLVGDLIVPDSCSIIFEPGVTLNLQNYILRVNGPMIANGLPNDSITLNGGAIILDSVNLITSYYTHNSLAYNISEISIEKKHKLLLLQSL